MKRRLNYRMVVAVTVELDNPEGLGGTGHLDGYSESLRAAIEDTILPHPDETRVLRGFSSDTRVMVLGESIEFTGE